MDRYPTLTGLPCPGTHENRGRNLVLWPMEAGFCNADAMQHA